MHPSRRLPCSAALLASLLLPSCASRGTPAAAPANGPANGLNNGLDALQAANLEAGPATTDAPATDLAAGLAAMTSDQPPLSSGDSLDDLVARQLAKQEQLRTLRDAPRASRSPVATADAASSDDATFAIDAAAARNVPLAAPRSAPDPETLARESSRAWDQAAAATTPAPATPPVIEPPAPAPEAAPEPVAAASDAVTEIAGRMAAMLREPGTPDRPRIADAAALATIESLRPGALSDLDNVSSSLASSLSPEDRATLLDARDRLASRPAHANEEIGKLLTAVSPAPTLTIARASLCTRVTGFGAYTPYPGTVFRAGQPIRAIVYIELDHFATRPARDGDQVFADAPIDQQVSVELSQSVSLFQDPGGLLAWHVPAQPITDTSRSKRRDFYLIQRIELPRTLSIGKYNIKVQVKDLVANAEAETVIPITVVAQ